MRGTSKLIVAALLSVTTFASVFAMSGKEEENRDRYCAKMKDGKKVVMHNGIKMKSEVTLSNGTRIMTDGTIIKSNGTRATLTVGECMTKEGIIQKEDEKNDTPNKKY